MEKLVGLDRRRDRWLQKIGTIFQNVARLTVEVFADGLECGKTYGLCFAGLEHGKILRRDVHAVGQIVQAHFTLREDDVEIDDDGHRLKR